jgi:hypothetical protein
MSCGLGAGKDWWELTPREENPEMTCPFVPPASRKAEPSGPAIQLTGSSEVS